MERKKRKEGEERGRKARTKTFGSNWGETKGTTLRWRKRHPVGHERYVVLWTKSRRVFCSERKTFNSFVHRGLVWAISEPERKWRFAF